MSARRSVALFFWCLTLALAPTPHAFADSYSAVVVYGDSLSDNGNLYALTGFYASLGLPLTAQPASPPYYAGRFSNGPVAVEQLAAKLNAPLVDFAYGGATTGIGNYGDGGTQSSFGLLGLPGMLTELSGSAGKIPSSIVPSSLFVVWGGANDVFSGSTADLVSGQTLMNAVTNLVSIVSTLQGEGATHILVPGLPDLGLTPELYGNAFATAYSLAFNKLLQNSLPVGATYADTFNLLHQITAAPANYGFTDVTDSCLTTTSLCSDPQDYLFWDNIHPTTKTDAILANAFASDIATTPEPPSLLLLSGGLFGLAVLATRRRLATSQRQE